VWQRLALLMWGAVDMIPDAATASAAGAVILTGLQDVDVIVRHGQSFAKQGSVIT